MAANDTHTEDHEYHDVFWNILHTTSTTKPSSDSTTTTDEAASESSGSARATTTTATATTTTTTAAASATATEEEGGREETDGGRDGEAERERERERVRPRRTDVTWAEIPWDVVRAEAAARAIAARESSADGDVDVGADRLAEIERDSAGSWRTFYDHFEAKFFKDRNYLAHSFPEIAALPPRTREVLNVNGMLRYVNIDSTIANKFKIFEAGCGVGNTLLPLMALLPECHFFGCDCSPRAIDILQKHEKFDSSRCKPFVCDLTQPLPPVLLETIPRNSIDVIVIVFTLSAILPHQLNTVISNLWEVLAPGGKIFIRDYGLYDLAQMRLSNATYNTESLGKFFTDCNFTIGNIAYDTRELLNRKRKITMYRVWIQEMAHAGVPSLAELAEVEQAILELLSVAERTCGGLAQLSKREKSTSVEVESCPSKFYGLVVDIYNKLQRVLDQPFTSEALPEVYSTSYTQRLELHLAMEQLMIVQDHLNEISGFLASASTSGSSAASTATAAAPTDASMDHL
ncbi:methyltransferase protein 2-A [Pelomyxa schiedti]|nr:methyltransferase protein 2-A [Pelomyxa schiedti]